MPDFTPAPVARTPGQADTYQYDLVVTGGDTRSLTASPQAIRRLPAPVQHGVIEALARSIHVAFLCAIPHS